jgi:predicted RNase H-like HicB family nuclease
MKYAVVLEQGRRDSWGAFPIDLSGVAITEHSLSAALESVNIGIEMQLENLAENGFEVPESVTAPAHPVEGLEYVSGYTFFDEMPEEWKKEALDGLPELLRKAKRLLREGRKRDRLAG